MSRLTLISESSLIINLRTEANFEHHPNSVTVASKVNIVRYPPNPAPYWGPAKRASGSGAKRKREGEEQ